LALASDKSTAHQRVQQPRSGAGQVRLQSARAVALERQVELEQAIVRSAHVLFNAVRVPS
jgi:hypothetical protein